MKITLEEILTGELPSIDAVYKGHCDDGVEDSDCHKMSSGEHCRVQVQNEVRA